MPSPTTTSVVAVAGVVVAGLSFWVGTKQTDASTNNEALFSYISALQDEYGNCEAFQDRVLKLRDAGLSETQIIQVVNGETAPDAEQMDRASDLKGLIAVSYGPAYDVYFKHECGDIGTLLKYADGLP